MCTQKRTVKRMILELLCLTLAFCTIFGMMPMYASEAPAPEASAPKQVVVAKKDIRKGVMLTEMLFELKTLKEGEKVPSNAITDISQVVKKYAKIDIYEGEYLQRDQISSQKVAAANSNVVKKPVGESSDPYLVVTDYIEPNTDKDLSGAIQELIEANPNRTIYFPDGEYFIAKSIIISGAATDSVSLELSDGAVIKAAKTWKPSRVNIAVKVNDKMATKEVEAQALIVVGEGSQNNNNIVPKGSYFGIKGGTLDGNGRANGILYAGGRESLIRNICIKNVTVGLEIAYGVNNGSSDADFEDISIYGDPTKDNSKGIWIKGHDNTFTNIRIYDMQVGIDSNAGSSLYKNIYVETTDPTSKKSAGSTIGIRATTWAWFSQCYVKNCATAYYISDSKTRNIISDCIAVWDTAACTKQTVFNVDGHAPSPVGGIRVEFFGDGAETAFFANTSYSSKHMIEGCIFDKGLCDNKNFTNWTDTPIIPIS